MNPVSDGVNILPHKYRYIGDLEDLFGHQIRARDQTSVMVNGNLSLSSSMNSSHESRKRKCDVSLGASLYTKYKVLEQKILEVTPSLQVYYSQLQDIQTHSRPLSNNEAIFVVLMVTSYSSPENGIVLVFSLWYNEGCCILDMMYHRGTHTYIDWTII